jgi:hypothetical protein
MTTKTKKIIPLKNLVKKAQVVFNAWVRRRDSNLGCISCTTGGVHNAGHFYHGHLYAALRFNEVNVNGQCIECNLSKAGNPEGYRKGLIERYGQQKVDLLDSAARHKKTYSRFELEAIIKMYQ